MAAADRVRHIAWDIGSAALGLALAGRLDAAFLHQPYSRLVIDCNRDPAADDAMPEASDGTPIPGNRGLDRAARAERVAAIHAPYQTMIGEAIERRLAAGRPTILVSLHSFTPRMNGVDRPWHAGVLHGGGEAGFSQALLAALGAFPGLIVGDNQPYRMDGTDHSVPRHAFPRGLPYAEIEVRQDLIGDAAGAAAMAARLAVALLAARDRPG